MSRVHVQLTADRRGPQPFLLTPELGQRAVHTGSLDGNGRAAILATASGSGAYLAPNSASARHFCYSDRDPTHNSIAGYTPGSASGDALARNLSSE